MRLSARNQLSGTVIGIEIGAVMATVKVDVSGQTITAAVTKEAVAELGSPVVALVKSTEVMLGVED